MKLYIFLRKDYGRLCHRGHTCSKVNTHSDLTDTLSLKRCIECLACREPAEEGGNGQVVWGTKRIGLSCRDARGKELSCSPEIPRRARMATLEMKL